jgi:hypothetical protein
MADHSQRSWIPEEVREAAGRIDPRMAVMTWWYGDVLDPYDQRPPDPDACTGRLYFLIDPTTGTPVEASEVRSLHPEIPDDEWKDLMREAAARDKSFDPFPFFHGYR